MKCTMDFVIFSFNQGLIELNISRTKKIWWRMKSTTEVIRHLMSYRQPTTNNMLRFLRVARHVSFWDEYQKRWNGFPKIQHFRFQFIAMHWSDFFLFANMIRWLNFQQEKKTIDFHKAVEPVNAGVGQKRHIIV